MKDDILVSISCITYNHEPFIRQCLDGFLMQKTDFAFEVLVHDDASTDNTSNIVREYQSKYPDIFKPIIQTENQYSKGVRSFSAQFNFPRAQGKYIALCEGDDYWIDPYKLQKQFDFMEANPQYSLCFHKAKVLLMNDISNKRVKKNIYDHLEKREYSGEEIYEKWTIPTASTFFRNYNNYLQNYHDSRFIFGDTILFLRLVEKGKLYCLEDVMSVYRRAAGGMTLSTKKTLGAMIAHYDAIDDMFKSKYRKISNIYRTSAYLYYMKKIFPSVEFVKLGYYILQSPRAFGVSLMRKLKSRL